MIFHIRVLVSLVDSYDDCVGDDGFLLEPFAVFAFWVFLILESHIVALRNNCGRTIHRVNPLFCFHCFSWSY